MRTRIIFWALAGFLIAACWAIFLWATFPTMHSRELMDVARVTCPISVVSEHYHFGVSWRWALVSNAVIYGLVGLVLEPFWHLGRHAKTTSRDGLNMV